MIKRIKIPKEYNSRFLKKDNFEFKGNKQLVLLYGCNGVGKSSLLKIIEDGIDPKKFHNLYFKFNGETIYDGKEEKIETQEKYYSEIVEHSFKNKIPKIYYWKASEDAPIRNQDRKAYEGEYDIEHIQLLLDANMHSEGESLELTFRKLLKKIPEDTDLLLIDELDSGLGANYVHTCGHILMEWLEKHKQTQCILAINNYHWVWLFGEVYRMDIGEYQKINNYDEFWEITRDIAIEVYNKEKRREDLW